MVKIHKALLGGSLILLITFNIYNALNFFFQFSMARLLTIVDYGILATLYSITYVLNIFMESLQTVMTKYSTNEDNPGKLKNLLKRSLKKMFTVSLVLFAIYLVIAIPLSSILQIDYMLMVITGLLIFTALLIPVNRGVMLGRKMFKSLGWNLVTESSSKLILSVLFVMIGWKVYGAMIGSVIGMGIAFFFSFLSLKGIMRSKEKEKKVEGIYTYTIPVLIITGTITLFYSLDVVFAKIFFDPTVAGSYAIASILSKIMFWGSQPISRAMLPISSKNNKKEKKEGSVVKSALILLILFILGGLIGIYFFSNQLINVFSGKIVDFAGKNILLYLGLSTSILSITNLLLLYRASKEKAEDYSFVRQMSILPVFLIIEVLAFCLFHSSLMQFSISYVVSSSVFLIGSIFLIRRRK